MSKYVYVLRLDFYHEWAWENGSAELVMVSDNINTITSKLKSCLEQELFESDNRIVESPDISIDELIDGAIERFCSLDSDIDDSMISDSLAIFESISKRAIDVTMQRVRKLHS